MTIDGNHKVEDILKNFHSFPSDEKFVYQRIAGYNLGRIRNQHFPNKLSAMAATLQDNHFRETLNPKDLERQLRRWISNGLPLENIQPIADALNISPSELLTRRGLPSELSPSDHSSFGKESASKSFQDNVGGTHETTENDSSFIFGWRRKYLGWFGSFTVLVLVLVTAFFWRDNYLKPELVTILWPNIADTNSEYVSGKLVNFRARANQDISVKLFVKPSDGDRKYWLNTPDYPPVVTKGGEWYQKCRFGDEDIRTMKKGLPLRFDLYAVAIEEGNKLPMDPKQNFFEADSEKEFLKMLEPYAVAVSERFSLVRVESARHETPIVLAVAPPVKLTWSENVPMYLEIYHGGRIIKNGYFSSGDIHDLLPSQILYEIKMSRKQGFHQNSTWILVEIES